MTSDISRSQRVGVESSLDNGPEPPLPDDPDNAGQAGQHVVYHSGGVHNP